MPRESEQRSFKYKARTKEDVKSRANMRGGNFDSIIKPQYKVYKVKEGKNLIRILPPTWEDAKHYGYDLYVNYGIGADNQSYLSLSKMKGEKDPLQEAKRAAESEGDKETAKALSPTQRIAMWIIDRQAEDEGPQLWLAPFTVDKDICNISFDEDTKEVVFVDDPENGCDVRFYKEGTGRNTRYDASKMRLLKPSPLSEDEGLQNEWLEYVNDNSIPDCIQFYDYEHISMVFGGQARVEKADDDEETPRSRRAAKPAADEDEEPAPARRRPAPVEDDEEPAPRSRRKPVVEADEDDEEPAPPPRRRAAVVDEEDEEPAEKPAARPSIRDRLKNRREKPPFDEDE